MAIRVSEPRRTFVLIAPLVLLGGCAVPAQPEEVGAETQAVVECPPEVPDDSLAASEGNRLTFAYDAVGVQIYECRLTGGVYGWMFKAPEAELFKDNGQIVIHHFGGPTGPTWEALDGSTVVGERDAGVIVDPTAIPWLLLHAKSHAGRGRMTPVTYIQRLDTTGGLAPPDATCGAANVGEVQRVPYTATYYFYVEEHDSPSGQQCAEHPAP